MVETTLPEFHTIFTTNYHVTFKIFWEQIYYFKVGQKVISKWGRNSYFKVGQCFFQSGAKVISNWGSYLQVGQNVISKWGSFFKVG